MSWKYVWRSLILACPVVACLLSSQVSHVQQAKSFRSVNVPDRYIRHRQFFGYLDRIVEKDKLGRKDATFRILPGLAGKCQSFESVNYPGHFLRHQDFRLKLTKRTEDRLFKEDATFCSVPGLGNAEGRSFESVNFPKHYIRHLNFELWLAKPDGTQVFKKDATFLVSNPLTESFPGVIDDGPQLVPAPRE